jgi:hypothetical protein
VSLNVSSVFYAVSAIVLGLSMSAGIAAAQSCASVVAAETASNRRQGRDQRRVVHRPRRRRLDDLDPSR